MAIWDIKDIYKKARDNKKGFQGVDAVPVASFAPSSRGLWAGGHTGDTNVYANVIDYITFGSTGNATDFGDVCLC